MNTQTQTISSQAASAMTAQQVVSVGAEGVVLVDGSLAKTAASCLLKVDAGDTVLCSTVGECTYVLSILERTQANAQIHVAGAQQVRWIQKRLSVTALEHLDLTSMGDAELNAPAGAIKVTAQNWFNSVSNAMVENAKQKVGQFGDWVMSVSGLVRSHSEHSLISSEQEYRVDAKRINFG